jgi:cobalamin synthase
MNNFGDIIAGLIFAALFVALANPLHFWMPTPVTMLILLIACIVAAVYAGFIMREQREDEREELHRMLADRAGFLGGIGVLTIALVCEGFLLGRIDAWIPLTIAAMIFIKVIVRVRANRRR